MKHFSLMSLKLRSALVVLLGVVLIFGILLGGRQELSWAAPEQSPNQQTVPPRTPESPSDPDPAPPPAPEDNNDDDDEVPPPPPEPTDEVPSPTPTPELEEVAQPPTPTPEQSAETPPPTPTPEPGDSADSDQVSSSQTPGLEENESQDEPLPLKLVEPEDGEDSARVIPQQADLSLSKAVDNPTPEVGEVVMFIITVNNSGPSNAINVAVSNPLPIGLSLSSATPSQGSFNKATGLWTVSAIAPDQSVTLSMVARVTNVGAMENTAEIIAVGQFDPDSTPGNGLEGEDDQDSAPIEAFLEIAPATQSDNSQLNPSDNEAVSVTASGPEASPEQALDTFGPLNWLYALGLGLLLILGGLFLTNRS